MKTSLAKSVLCFGDSNTYGTKPDKSGRFELGVRWTSILQELLGEDYYVIEEGLGGRTTDLEHPKPEKPNRNGFEYFKPCLESHLPLDYLVIMLGTNDWKLEYDRTSEQTVEVVKQFVDYAKTLSKEKTGSEPRIILVSPIRIDTGAELFSEYYTGIYDSSSKDKAETMPELLQGLAEEIGCGFVDAGSVAKSGIDGLHIDEVSQEPLAQAIKEEITK